LPPAPRSRGDLVDESGHPFRLCRLAAALIERADQDARAGERLAPKAGIPDLAWARELLAAIEEKVANGDRDLTRLVPAVQTEIAVAAAECDADTTSAAEQGDPLFRVGIERWALTRADLADLVCVRDQRLRVLAFDFDVTELMSVRNAHDLAAPPSSRRSYILAFGLSGPVRRSPLAVDRVTARILELADATRSASEIVGELVRNGDLPDRSTGFVWIEDLFARGLLLLRKKDRLPACDVRPPTAAREHGISLGLISDSEESPSPAGPSTSRSFCKDTG
jgi:hypothetical protein